MKAFIPLMILLITIVPWSHARAQSLPQSPSIEYIGPEEVVFDYSMQKCGANDIPDTPAHAFRDADGKVNLIASHFDSYRMTGISLDSLSKDCSRIMASTEDGSFSSFRYHEWIHSTYTEDGINVYALVHNEWYAWLANASCWSHPQTDGWVNAITLAVSNDKGASFHHPADYKVIVPPVEWNDSFSCTDTGRTAYGAFNPVGIVKTGGYYYTMFSSVNLGVQSILNAGMCIMRTNDLSKAPWEVWTSNGWNASGKAVCLPIEPGKIDGGLSLTWNNYTSSYMLMIMGMDGVYFSLSKDLFHWTDKAKIVDYTYPSDSYWYPSLLNPMDTSRDFEYTGQESYLYYTRFNGGGYASGTMDRDLVRRKIRFSYPGDETRINQASPSVIAARKGAVFNITYSWYGKPMGSQLTAFVHFVNDSGDIAFQDDHLPHVSTAQWSGDISYTRTVTVPASAKPGTYSIMAGLYNATQLFQIEPGAGVLPDPTWDSRRYQIGTVLVYSGDETRINQASPSVIAARKGAAFNITYSWYGKPMGSQLTAFVHFVNDSGDIAFQDDHLPPVSTAQWSGDISYTRTVTVPASAKPGTYGINAGLYNVTQGNAELFQIQPGAGVIPLTGWVSDHFRIGALSVYRRADLGMDGSVDSVDFLIMKSDWNSQTKPPADLNQDGSVNSTDMGIMMSQWSG